MNASWPSLLDALALLGGTVLFASFAVTLWRGQTWFLRTSREPPEPPGRVNVVVSKWFFTLGAVAWATGMIEFLAHR